MRIIVERYQYEAEKVYDVLKDVIPNLNNVRGHISVDYVGYFYNTMLNDCVFILPKVLLENKNGEELVFGKYKPEDIINLETSALTEKESKNEHDFIYKLSVWIYRSLVVYNERNKNNEIIRLIETQEMGKRRMCRSNTFLDILLAIQKFNNENQDFFFFILKNIHSGYNKINWTRTISHSNAIVQDGNPIYLNPVNKKRQVNFDEELLIIFFSILNYMHETYGFPVNINVNFSLIKGAMFKNYLYGMGKTRLMQIKYKYFSDKAKYLWELCYAFFDQSKKIMVETLQKEYLLVTRYDIVFEAIIDELIGDKNLPDGLKEQEDGKKVDHLYTYRDLALNDEKMEKKLMYYIGDSKYYKRNTNLKGVPLYKQFTYAKNVIQWNLNLFMNEGEKDENWKNKVPMLRDDVTEGYNIIPNFFISALQNDLESHSDITLITDKEPYFSQRQFKNRLYDRDTLLLAHYNVNFLYVISLYGKNNESEKKAWKEKARKKFREEIQGMLNAHFQFYAMTAHADVDAEQYMRKNFKKVIGKVFTPFDDKDYYSLALQNADEFKEENKELIDILSQDFNIKECSLGVNPETLLEKPVKIAVSGVPKNFLTHYWLEANINENVLIGCFRNNRHLSWIQGNNQKKQLIYNVRLGNYVKGGQSYQTIERVKVKFVILYDFMDENRCFAYRVNDTCIKSKEELIQMGYNNAPRSNKYYCYIMDEEISFGQLNISQLLSARRIDKMGDFIDGEPFFITCGELLKYREN